MANLAARPVSYHTNGEANSKLRVDPFFALVVWIVIQKVGCIRRRSTVVSWRKYLTRQLCLAEGRRQ
jgi:hypothetical protein